jgi:hypothetical protein
LVSLIIVWNLPFSAIEWPEFHTFCQALNPELKDFITTTHSQVKNKIEKAYEIHKDTVWKKLQSALTSIHLSVDIWTSPNKHLLLGVTGGFIDCMEEKHLKTLLGLRSVAGHSGDDQFDVLLPLCYGHIRASQLLAMMRIAGTSPNRQNAVSQLWCTSQALAPTVRMLNY